MRIEVIPNFFNKDIFKNSVLASDRILPKTIIFFGSESHYADCELKIFIDAIIKIFNEFNDINFLTIGFKSKKLHSILRTRYTYIEGQFDIKSFKRIWGKYIINSYISVCPLISSSFNKSKSPIKYFESAAAKVPFVASDIHPYNDVIINGINGYICKSKKDWYISLKNLLTSTGLKNKIINRAYDDIYENFQLKNNLSYYYSLFNSV